MTETAEPPQHGPPILLVGYRALGDFVRTHSAVRLAVERHPGSPIDMLVPSSTAAAARAMDHVRHVFELPMRGGHTDFLALRDVARQLRAASYRRAYVIPRSLKAALPVWMAGIPERVGYPFEFRFGLVNVWPPDWRSRVLSPNDAIRWRGVDQACDTVRDHSKPIPSEWPEPRMVVRPEDRLAARFALGAAPDDRVLAIYSAGMKNPRSWPVDRCVHIARRFLYDGWRVWLVGGTREKDYVANVRAEVPECVDCTDATLETAIHQLAAADLYLGVDAGLSHVAAALGTPSAIIFPAFAPRVTGPINAHAIALEPPVAATLPFSAPSAVSVEQVEAALNELLARAAAAIGVTSS